MAKQSMNLVVISGNLTDDPKQFGEGDSVMVRASLGMSNYKGERQFPSLVAYGRLAAVFLQHCKKGTAMTVRGQLQIRPYEQNGQTKYATDIVVQEMFFGAQETLEDVASGQQDQIPVRPTPPPSQGNARGFSNNRQGSNGGNGGANANYGPRRQPTTQAAPDDDEPLF